MVRNASLFSQLLQHVSRTEFAALTRQHRAERGSKGFTCQLHRKPARFGVSH